jgi:hypothetical protein
VATAGALVTGYLLPTPGVPAANPPGVAGAAAAGPLADADGIAALLRW